MARTKRTRPKVSKESEESEAEPPAPLSEPLVVATGVSRVYSTAATRVVALDNVDFLVRRGEMVSVMGPSGSGKTTLLNCLSGLDEITSGEVAVEGTSLAKMSDAERTRYRARRMGFVFQAFNLLPVFNAVENVELPLLLGGTKSSAARRRALEALDLVGLSERGVHRPAELSAGEQQRVAIARAIAPRPAVLWADEPTGNLDSDNASKVIELMRSLNRLEGLTIVLVTHDAQVARDAGRLVLMRDGRIYDGERGSPL